MAAEPGGLSAPELAGVVAEIDGALRMGLVTDCARVRDRDDLLVFVETAGGKRALHIAPGGRRARVCLTRRHFARTAFATGPLVDRLRERLAGSQVLGADHTDGERCCALRLRDAAGQELALAVELFGPRGLWCLVGAGGVALELSRVPTSKTRKIGPGLPYLPPPGAPDSRPASVPRFAPPLNESIDTHFTERDLTDERDAVRDAMRLFVERALRKLRERVAGLQRQQQEITRAPEIRLQADMLLAYGFGARKGQPELVVPHPAHDGEELTIPLDARLPVAAQAQRLYQRARKLEDAVEVSQQRLAAGNSEIEALTELAGELENAEPDRLDTLQRALRPHGYRDAAPKAAAGTREPKARPKSKRGAGDAFRRFSSSEGHAILVGRTNEENDRLTLRTARGNDLWLHIGRGLAGSHVVVRLPRGKTASLATMLDAATLAVHFSKARGQPRCEVIYTAAKHVRKPKGLPPGRVVPHHTKTLTVDLEPDRLRRLLDSVGPS